MIWTAIPMKKDEAMDMKITSISVNMARRIVKNIVAG